MGLKEGDLAPDFELQDHRGNIIRLSDYKGRIVVLYFYPRAMTSGCTRETAKFNELLEEFEKLGAVVLGASTDSISKNARFAEKLGVRFSLLSDKGGRVADAYGALRKGRCPSALRVTFIIGPEGRVVRVLKDLRPAEKHAEEALSIVRSLAGQRNPH